MERNSYQLILSWIGLLFMNLIMFFVVSKLIKAARETGALKEAKDKLEKNVEELTWRLQLEKRLRVIFLSCRILQL